MHPSNVGSWEETVDLEDSKTGTGTRSAGMRASVTSGTSTARSRVEVPREAVDTLVITASYLTRVSSVVI